MLNQYTITWVFVKKVYTYNKCFPTLTYVKIE